MSLKAPFPWFGGKSRVAHLVWERFGDAASYNEPFAGSLAVLLGRPHEARIETVNDLDCYLSNFWRALRHDPDEVAYWADYPVNETDLHARHKWLVEQKDFRAKLAGDPDYCNTKIAGWWVWGQCLWIGSGWCQRPDWTGRANAGRAARGVNALAQKRPAMNGSGQAGGIHRQFDRNPQGAAHQKRRPQLSTTQGGASSGRRWQGGGQAGGSGVHAPSLSKQKPVLNGGGDGDAGRGIHASHFDDKTGGLYQYMRTLAARLRRVRVCCGDWKRVLTPSVTTYIGTTAVFLDPPYDHDLRERCYSEDHNISGDVREWAIANAANPDFRIALCGYEGEHAMPESWECVAWKAHGGYSRSERGKANRAKERIWFSPNCLKPEQAALL